MLEKMTFFRPRGCDFLHEDGLWAEIRDSRAFFVKP